MKYIPKIIHLIWFGNNLYPPIVDCCISSWKKFFPDYLIKVWNEESFNISDNAFVKEAYEVGKYAFVSDFVRLYVLYHYGGIYLDTDVEVVKNFEELLRDEHAVTGYANSMWLSTGFMATEKHNDWIKALLEYYENRHFILSDGSYDQRINNAIISEISSQKYGFRKGDLWLEYGNVRIYPQEYFTPYRRKKFDFAKDEEKRYEFYEIDKQKTCCIHYCMASWDDGDHGFLVYLKRFVRNYFPRFFVEWIERKYYQKKYNYHDV